MFFRQKTVSSRIINSSETLAASLEKPNKIDVSKQPRGRIFQDDSFVFSEFNGLKLEKLMVCENIETKNPIIVFLKVENNNWHQFFLDMGFGVWENWDKLDTKDDNYSYVEYTNKFELSDKKILRIHCEPDGINCQIIVEFENNEKLILRTKEPELLETTSELIKTKN